ncbi:GDP-fucose transporter 1 [Canna indica]|uniref:GDP-fucose transporter 1 n=1 Tax=Canna indica TaxID=4628 RepID=A0AAQ3KSX5_9LILI|nr:GDP-fucose transporter 1 [Canna indica]
MLAMYELLRFVQATPSSVTPRSSDTPSPLAYSDFSYLGLLAALQYLTPTLSVWVLGKLDVLYHDPFTLDNAKKFLPVALIFYLVIFTNTNLLCHANVDTFIIFCSLTPLLVAIADTVFRSKPCPSKLAFLSLLIILSGAVSYVTTDSTFSLTAYFWAAAYLVTITTEMVNIKHMVTNLDFNTWGFVFDNNLLSLLMSPLFWIAISECVDVFTAAKMNSTGWWNLSAFVAMSLSGVVTSF